MESKKRRNARLVVRESEEDYDWKQAAYVTPKKMEHRLISIRLPVTMINQLRYVALAKGDIGYQQVIKTFIADGLQKWRQSRMAA
ncbi:MAG: hypothetical protein HY586_01070 [Candidatus Omnitrophica bacterium]|nr:hypothetical protein [Candidatus Omnitrophota bacterium]